MTRLPLPLAIDYARTRAWPYVLAGLALTVLVGATCGAITASDLIGR